MRMMDREIDEYQNPFSYDKFFFFFESSLTRQFESILSIIPLTLSSLTFQ